MKLTILEKRLFASTLILITASFGHAATLYVWQTSPSPALPYTTWNSAAHTIQPAIDAAAPGDTIMVRAGEFLLTAEITVGKAIVLQSESGPIVTIVNGQGTERCLAVTDAGAIIDGFTVRNGRADGSGGGGISLLGATVQNCIVTNCLTQSVGGSGIYMSGGLVRNSRLIGNGLPGAEAKAGG